MAVNESESDAAASTPATASAAIPLPGPADGWDPNVNQDELILAQEKRIEAEIANRSALVSGPETLDKLMGEYADDDSVYRTKIEDLKTNYQYLRRTRPDGNCFFRAFVYAYLETLLNDELELNRFSAIIEERKNDLIELGMPSFTIEDFYDQFVGVLERIQKDITTHDSLLEVLNDQGISDYLVVFLRIITSGYLQKNQEFFSNFIEGYQSVKDFCGHEVEPMYRESDHIHIIGLTSACDVSVRINHLDRGGDEKVSLHTFPEGSEPRIHLLYRPGHYDILYPQSAANAAAAAAATGTAHNGNVVLENQSAEITSSSNNS